MTCRPAWCWRKRGVRTRDETEEGKQEAELSVAPALLWAPAAALAGRVVTGDALYCQHALCRQIRQAGGHFLFAVKANQPELAADVALLFDQPPPGEVFTVAHSHGRHGSRHEQRTLWASSALTAYLAEAGWPQIQQVLRVERLVTEQGASGVTCMREVRDFVTSLGTPQGSAADLLALVRSHWRIENTLHYVRDVTLGEDASAIRSGVAPRVLAALRNTVLGLLH
jgi:predicted transposase YbfD/YdcC